MRAKQFNELLNSVRSLTQTQQRKRIDAALKASAIDRTVAAANERMTPEYPRPHCNSLTGTALARLKQDIAHECLNIKAGARVRQRVFHIRNVNAYDARLKIRTYFAWRNSE